MHMQCTYIVPERTRVHAHVHVEAYARVQVILFEHAYVLRTRKTTQDLQKRARNQQQITETTHASQFIARQASVQSKY